jgi:hypothetical protein
MKPDARRNRAALTLAMLWLSAVVAPATSARADDDVLNENQVSISTHHPIKGNLSGFGELGYHWSSEGNYEVGTILWGVTHVPAKWAQVSVGLRALYTDNEGSANKLEYRPFAGVKLFLQNKLEWNIYNYTRYEYRDTQDRVTREWTCYGRVRSRFGLEVPMTSREKAWQPKTWYALADAEPFYRFDTSVIDTVSARAGIGHIAHDRVRLEFIYYAQFTRPAGGSSLDFTENIFRLNVKVGMKKGLLRRLQGANTSD